MHNTLQTTTLDSTLSFFNNTLKASSSITNIEMRSFVHFPQVHSSDLVFYIFASFAFQLPA